MSESQSELHPLLRTEDVESTSVYPLVHMIKADVSHYIDTPLSYDALTAPDLTYTLVRPLVEKYTAIQQEGNLSVVFCCLINRVHFIRDTNLTTATISRTRASLCEIMAARIFRFNADNILRLTVVLTTSWPVYSGADPTLLARAREERDDDLEERVGNAIEMAILGKAKRFIMSSACQKVIDVIWSGKCVYQAESSHSILSDTYKKTPIHFYDPHKAPLLDHYRLKVPYIRAVLDYLDFLILFILFLVALEFNERERFNLWEISFMVYSLGFTLEKVAAMQEHGIKVYSKGTWNGFDLAYITAFAIYASLRIYGIHQNDTWSALLGVDVLAVTACLMFPRLAFVTFKDNLMVLALRAMIMQFTYLMLIASFCFCGFLYALWTLSRDDARYSPGLITWWLLDLFFSFDAIGFDKATTFHPVFGPALMISYACLSNTLLLTVLVSILSNTFASVNEDAAAEAMFRKAVSTIEGAKADYLFSYQPPVNLVALCIMLPASYILSPRWFHKVNVFMIRLTSFPILLTISFYERQSKLAGTITLYETIVHFAEKVFESLPRFLKRMTFFEGLAGADADITAVFELEEEDSALDIGGTSENSPIYHRLSEGSLRGWPSGRSSPPKTISRPRLNSIVNKAEGTILSPLAHIYSPVPQGDNVEDQFHSGTSIGPGISYGPATRRPHQTTHRFRKSSDASFPHYSNPLRKFPTMSDNSSPPRQGIWGSTSEELLTRISTAKETRDTEDATGEEPALVDRLNSMEKRQERIENLLIQISQGLGSRTQ